MSNENKTDAAMAIAVAELYRLVTEYRKKYPDSSPGGIAAALGLSPITVLRVLEGKL